MTPEDIEEHTTQESSSMLFLSLQDFDKDVGRESTTKAYSI